MISPSYPCLRSDSQLLKECLGIQRGCQISLSPFTISCLTQILFQTEECENILDLERIQWTESTPAILTCERPAWKTITSSDLAGG